jgi:RNA polymerase sigma factor (sigma-70 family)
VDAFSALYRAHVGAVRAAVRDNVHDPEGIADVVQDTFVRALERLPSLREPERFRPWLLSIARHVAIDARRVRQRSKTDDGADTADIESTAPEPDELAELGELAALVNGCVGGLSPRDAAAIALVTRFGFSPNDVALAFEITPGAAKVVVHRARRRLRDALTLELNVRASAVPCATLAAYRAAGDLVEAGRHVRDCDECLGTAVHELSLYDASGVVHKPSIRT